MHKGAMCHPKIEDIIVHSRTLSEAFFLNYSVGPFPNSMENDIQCPEMLTTTDTKKTDHFDKFFSTKFHH